MEKTFKTYDELLDILSDRGIDLSTSELRGRAKCALQHEGYYNLINGYKTPFLQRDANGYILIPDTYLPNVTVDEIRSLYLFDRKLRSIILRATLQIETNIKNLVSHTFSSKHGHKNYLVYNNFDVSQKDSVKNISKLFAEIQRQISNRVTDPSIAHYLRDHGYIPLWVLNNVLTFGTVSKFYSLMKQPERQEVAKVFGVRDKELTSILTTLSAVRNVCAHSNRLYCFRTKRTLVDLSLHAQLSIPKNEKDEYQYGKRDLFSVMIALKATMSKNDFRIVLKQIKNVIRDTNSKFIVLSESDILSYMGFPEDWYNKLKQNTKEN